MEDKIDEVDARLAELESKFYNLSKSVDFAFWIIFAALFIIFWKLF